MAYTSIGKEILLKFAEKVSDFGVIEKQPKLEGRSMVMYLAPKKNRRAIEGGNNMPK